MSTKDNDPRVRIDLGAHGAYRSVAPEGKLKDGRFFINGRIVVEKRGKDSLGNETWTQVTAFSRPDKDSLEPDAALYWLLAGPGAE